MLTVEQLRWIGLKRDARVPRVRLIAFPYAGGGAAIYRRWLTDLCHREWVDFVAIELPGRGQRSLEPLVSDMDTLLQELCPTLLALNDLPCILFGFSMGALIAYESALKMTAQSSCPRHLVLAARHPPFGVLRAPRAGKPSRLAVTSKVQRLGGMSAEVLGSELYESHLLPILEADFCLVDNCVRPFPQVLPCPVLALAGTEDPEVSPEQIRNWRLAAGRGFRMQRIEGGHFFLHSAHANVMAEMETVVEEVLRVEIGQEQSSETQFQKGAPLRRNEDPRYATETNL